MKKFKLKTALQDLKRVDKLLAKSSLKLRKALANSARKSANYAQKD